MLLSSLLSGAIGVEEALQTAQRYELPLAAQQYVLAMIRPQEKPNSQETIHEPELLYFAMMNIAQEICSHIPWLTYFTTMESLRH